MKLKIKDKFFKKEPWEHQLETINKTLDRNFYALFYDMGAGKTSTVINICRAKFAQHGTILRTLVLTPLSVVTQFKNEWSKFGGDIYDEQAVAVAGNTKAQKLKCFKKDASIFVINHDSLNVKDLLQAMWDFDPQIIIVDESHRFKNGTAKKTKNLLSLVDGKRYEDKIRKKKNGDVKKVRTLVETRNPIDFRFILTGTPILNSPLDIWPQMNILSRDIFPQNFLVFRGQYMIDANERFKGHHNYFPNWQPKTDCFNGLNSIIYQNADRVLKKDCMDLPPFMREKLSVELTAPQRKHYKEMRDEFVTFLNENDMKDAMVAEMALVKALRLQQLVCGIFVHDEKDDKGRRIVTKIPNNRIKVLEEALEGLVTEHKAIVWCTFADAYDDLQEMGERLSKQFTTEDKEFKFCFLTGRQNQTEKDQSIYDFQNDPETRIIFANQAAGGTGVNLTAASYSFYYSKNFNLEHDEQSEARNYRGGSDVHESITRYDLYTPDTIDETILEALERKASMAKAILKKGAV